MVVEPFSIVGLFGLTAGLIGFVASTIEKSAGQISTAKNAYQRMQGHQEALVTCKDRLEAWAHQWHGENDESHTEEELEFLWGSAGYEHVRRKMTIIKAEHQELLKLLYGSQWARSEGGQHALRWEKIVLDSIRTARLPTCAQSEMRDFFVRMSISLWKNNLLSSSLDRLKGYVNDLETTSCIRFHDAQGDTSKYHYVQPSKDDIDCCLRQRRRRIHLGETLRTAYEGLRTQDHYCELLLAPFEEAETYRLERQHELPIAFLTVCLSSPSIGTY